MTTIGLLVALLACSGDDDGGAIGPGPEPEPTGDTAPTGPTGDTAPVDDTLRLGPGDGTTAARTFSVGALSGLAGGDLRLDLGGLGADARGRAMLPGDVSELVLLELSTDGLDEAVALLAGRGPAPSDAVEWWSAAPTGTSVVLSAFEARGAPFVPDAYFTVDNPRSWLLMLRDEEGGVLHAASLAPDTAAGLLVNLDDGLSAESFTPGGGAPVSVVVGSAPAVDWSGAVDLYGAAVDPELADTLELFLVTPGAVVDPEAPLAGAEAVYRREVAGDTEAELSFLRADDQSIFGGFPADRDAWIALTCTVCASRAPLVLVPVQAEEAR